MHLVTIRDRAQMGKRAHTYPFVCGHNDEFGSMILYARMMVPANAQAHTKVSFLTLHTMRVWEFAIRFSEFTQDNTKREQNSVLGGTMQAWADFFLCSQQQHHHHARCGSC